MTKLLLILFINQMVTSTEIESFSSLEECKSFIVNSEPSYYLPYIKKLPNKIEIVCVDIFIN